MRPIRSFLPLVALSTYEPGLERARVDPEVGQLAHVRVGRDLEGQGAEGLVVVGGAEHFLVRDRVLADDRRHVQRRRQVVHDRVQHRLDALVLERRAGQHGHDAVLEGAQAQAALDVFVAERVALEVLVRQLVVHLGDGLDHLLALAAAGLEQVGRDVDRLGLGAQVLGPVDDRLHGDQVHDAAELVLVADRQLDRHRPRAQALADHARRSARSRRRCGPAC